MFDARKWTKVWCSCDVIQIYVNGIPYLLISQHAVNFDELDEGLSSFLFKISWKHIFHIPILLSTKIINFFMVLHHLHHLLAGALIRILS